MSRGNHNDDLTPYFRKQALSPPCPGCPSPPRVALLRLPPAPPHIAACHLMLTLSVGNGREALPALDVLACAQASGGHQAAVLRLGEQIFAGGGS